MKKLYLTIFFIIFIFFPLASSAQDLNLENITPEIDTTSQNQSVDEYFKGKVIKIIEEGFEEKYGSKEPYQKVELELLNGSEKGKIIQIEQGKTFTLKEWQKVKKDELVTILKTDIGDQIVYYITDKYRLKSLLIMALFFCVLVVLISKKRGFMAIIGLGFSFLVLTKLILPLLMAGYSAFWVSLLGSCIIALFSIYLAHGFNQRSTIALISIFITLGFSIILAVLFVNFAHLFGFGSEEAFYVSRFEGLNLKGLLLGGMIIGALGVLDDITTAQVAAVCEIKKANMKLNWQELYKRGLCVGKEHINALVNTLVLAYAGASLPLFLLFYNNEFTPFWVILNGEIIAEEIVRTLVGSTALVLAVPITTILAAKYFAHEKNIKKILESDEDFHSCFHGDHTHF